MGAMIESPLTAAERALIAEQAALLRQDFEDFAFDLLLAEWRARGGHKDGGSPVSQG